MFFVSCWSAPQQRAHTGQQFGERERLYQIIVRAQLESFHPIAHTVAGGEKKNRSADPVAPQVRDNLPAVFPWQHDIDDKEIKFDRAREVQTCFTVAREIDRESGFAKSFGQKSRGFLLVLGRPA